MASNGLSPGVVLGGRYELLGELASGGMATVWLAQVRAESGFRRLVAVKTCLPQLRGDEEFAAMFLDEARLAALIHHPNVVPTLDLGSDQALYLVMEFVDGDRLSALKKHGPLAAPLTIRIVRDALLGLHAAHELRDDTGQLLDVVHRDISPQNIMVGLDGGARVMDFGIAKARSRATVTQEGVVKGKLAYMAPEQLCAGPTDRRADIFAMGVVLWQVLTGERLFGGSSPQETLSRVLHAPIRPPSDVLNSIPRALDAVALRALSREPNDRYATAADFADALERCGVPIATQAEVAQLAERSFGEASRARRQELVGAGPTTAGPTTAARPSPPALELRPTEDDETVSELEPSAVTNAARGARGRLVPFVAVLAGALALTFVLAQLLGEAPAPPTTDPGSAPASARQLSAPTATEHERSDPTQGAPVQEAALGTTSTDDSLVESETEIVAAEAAPPVQRRSRPRWRRPEPSEPSPPPAEPPPVAPRSTRTEVRPLD